MVRATERLMTAALLAVVLAVFSHTRADPDLWGHVRFGQDAVAARGIVTADPYSFASDRPWINHEWLSEIVMYGAYAAAGGAGLVVLKLAVLTAMLGLVVTAWPAGIGRRTRQLLVGLVVIGTVAQANHVRPQLFSLVLFAALLKLLAAPPAALAVPWRRTLAVAIVFAFWANLHGGWIVGVVVLGLWGALTVWQKPAVRTVLIWSATLAAAIAATLLNPYGVGLWAFLHETVGFGRDQITDWQPVYRMPPAYLGLWLLVTMVAVAALARAVRARRIDLRSLAVAAMLGFAAFRVNRLLAFFALAVATLLAGSLSQAEDVPGDTVPASIPSAARRRPSPVAVGVAAVVGLITLTGALTFAYGNATCVRMDPQLVPEREAYEALANPSVRGRMITFFDWGEYAIWHFSPRVLVSIDGRRETVYSDEAIRAQLDLYRDPETRHALLARLHPDFIWLPAALPATASLERDGWIPVYSGSRSTLLSRHPLPPPHSVQFAAGRRCFPGP